jgi:hypothetical protein
LSNRTLFSKREIRTYLDIAHRGLVTEIQSLPAALFTENNADELAQQLVAKYSVTTPTLDEAGIWVDEEDTRIDVSKDPNRLLLDHSRPFYVQGTIYSHHVPFSGNADVFDLRPSYYSSVFPAANVNNEELVFAHEDTRHDATAVKGTFAQELAETKKLLGWADNDIRQHNDKIVATATTLLQERRDKRARDRAVVEQLGYPLRRRTDAPTTYAIPVVRKPLPVTLPAPLPTEPAPLTDATYEDILQIIHSMVLVMERSPNTFRDVNEDFLRTLFLVTLNAQYEGQATGETFNSSGKTDILIRHQNRNLFIAECKFWDGPKSLTDAIDQLLGYATWRDSKTAILLFSRNKEFNNVLGQIADTVKGHAHFTQQHMYHHETGFRFTLRQGDDPQRRITLTVLVFNIPT